MDNNTFEKLIEQVRTNALSPLVGYHMTPEQGRKLKNEINGLIDPLIDPPARAPEILPVSNISLSYLLNHEIVAKAVALGRGYQTFREGQLLGWVFYKEGNWGIVLNELQEF